MTHLTPVITGNTDGTDDTEDKSDKGDTGDTERSVQSSVPHSADVTL